MEFIVAVSKANAEVESKRASKILDNVSKLLGD